MNDVHTDYLDARQRARQWAQRASKAEREGQPGRARMRRRLARKWQAEAERLEREATC